MTVEVTIIRKITTVVKVEADSILAAIMQVRAYGLIEACSDYPLWNETVDAYIRGGIKVKE